MDILLTLLVFLVLMCCVLYKVKVHTDFNPDFFNKQATTAMRGIWSIIVIMVHIPPEYRNALQNMSGSFAYVGVTFFFMFSGFGLSLSRMRSGAIQKGFWLNRLPKLLVPQLLLNIVSTLLMYVAFGDKITIGSFVWVARWLRWLLACYLAFWIAHKLCKSIKWANVVVAAFVVVFSVTQYWMKHVGIITTTIWPTEVYGFLWGILLAMLFVRIQNAGKTHWLRKVIPGCITALLLGVLYLKFKTVLFWGDYLLKIALGSAIIGVVLFFNMRISIGNTALQKLGEISYELYLSHTIVISLIQRAMPEAKSGVFILIVLAASIMLSVIIHVISKLVLRRITAISRK